MNARRGNGRRAAGAPSSSVLERALAEALASLADIDPPSVRVSVEGVDVALLPARFDLAVSLTDDVDVARVSDASTDEVDAVDVVTDRGHDDDRDTGDGGADTGPSAEELDAEADAAADLLEGLLDALDLGGDLRIRVHESHAEVEIVDVQEGVLIGRRGQTLEAVQDLVQTAMQRRFERRSRVMVDVDGYRARRIERLLERADEAIERVLDGGEPERLEPMDVFERRLVHQRVAEAGGLVSRSLGREPGRRVVIEQA
jgi:spoIIIJ-associated protein